MHVGRLGIKGEKMSKSLGNTVVVDELGDKTLPYRLFISMQNYRNQVNFTPELFESYIKDYDKIKRAYLQACFTLDINGIENNSKDQSVIDEFIKHIAKFTSSVWQVHPFGEGNTRTTAVFIEKYLNNMGFDVNNDMFKEYSLYFRNALVRSNYGNIPKGIYPTDDYLVLFFENLLQGKNHVLSNKDLYINELFNKKNN